MSGHTPAPWFQGKQYTITTDGGKLMHCRDTKKIFSRDQDTTKGNQHGGLIGVADTEENARLIAAAPDLLAALQNVRTSHQTGHNEAEAWLWVDAAISKATSSSSAEGAATP